MPARAAKPSPRQKKRPVKPPTRLRLYNAKRDLAASGEPGGSARDKESKGQSLRFVIQKHDASRLHYDFRLEMEGVLRSWAVPKGLPVKTGAKVLAVEVEDHPISYGAFEGVIPAGNYGAGTVMLWDRGDYTVKDGTAEAAYRSGKIHLTLKGEKSVGEWTLVRMRPRPGEKSTNWLLIRNRESALRGAPTAAARDASVLSGKTLDEIAGGPKIASRATPKKKVPTVRSAAEKGKPVGRGTERATFIAPMKALSVEQVPAGPWRLEIKLDGYRAVAVMNDGEVDLWSRNQKPLTPDYPEVVAMLKRLRCAQAVLDGEIVALDAQGRSRFQLLQGRSLGGGRPHIVYYVFDLLHLDGRSLREVPIEERQRLLKMLVGKNKVVRFSPVFEAEPAALLEAVRQQGLEGIIAKKAGSLYEADRRSGTWLKCKVLGEQEFVIGGFTPPKNSRPYFGALLIGVYDGERLLYAGKVGSGYNHALLESLHGELMKRRIESCPFANLPSPRKPRFGTGMTAGEMREVTWVKPGLVCQVRFTEWTDDGMLRHPVFLGLRRDKAAREVVREAAPNAAAKA